MAGSRSPRCHCSPPSECLFVRLGMVVAIYFCGTRHPEHFASGHSFPQQPARNELEVELAWESSVHAVKIGEKKKVLSS